MMIKKARRLSLLAIAIVASSMLSSPVRGFAQSKCAEIFSSLFAAQEEVMIEGKFHTLESDIASKFHELKDQLIEGGMPDVIVYCPVATTSGVINVRFELTDGAFSEKVVGESEMMALEFARLLKMAQEPGGSFSRGVLARELLPGGYVAPRFDKPVLFKDISYYGILPQSLGMSGAVMIGSGLIRSSLQNLSRLPSLNAKPDEFVLINGYPRTADQIKAVFGSESQFDLDDWQEVAGEIEGIAIKHGISIESAEAGESFNEKAELLKLLTEAPHAIFLVAHADGCHIRLPGGGEIVLRPEDVYELRFEHAPFVVVRICNGVDNGYASAFLNAGASGVWMNRGVITPSQANSEIDLFLGALEEEKTVVDAVKAANAAATSSGLFVEQLPATRQRSVGMAR